MRFVFDNGEVREVPYDPKMAGRLIYLHQERGGADFKIQINPNDPKPVQEKKAREIEHYLEWHRNHGK